MNKIHTIQDIVDWGLCVGCGACYAACAKKAVELYDVERLGIRPRFDAEKCRACDGCLDVCPGYNRDFADDRREHTDRAFDRDLGPVIEIWEGYAAHSQFRYRGASGGVMSALALYGVESGEFGYAVQTGMDPEYPWRTRTFLNRDRQSILQCAGSRYAPASPCAVLRNVSDFEGSCAFLGKPCDVAAVVRMRRRDDTVREKIGLLIAHFCAGTPSTRGTLDVIGSLGMKPEDIGSLRYRGYGWPGNFMLTHRSNGLTRNMSYHDLWASLQRYCPFSCRLCPDGLGWSADISCGDAWHRAEERSIGYSLMIVRTEAGRRMLQNAMVERYIIGARVDPKAVVDSQQALLRKRRVLEGRLRAMDILGIPTTSFQGYRLAEYWKTLPFGNRMKEMIGTWKRVLTRNLWRPRPLWRAGAETAVPLEVETWVKRAPETVHAGW